MIQIPILIVYAYASLVAVLAIALVMKHSPSGFEDPKRGFVTFQDEYEKLKKELQQEFDRGCSLEEANQVMYNLGYKDGNLNAIKTIGKDMVEDHVSNIEVLEELPTREKMGKKPKQSRSKRIHQAGIKIVDMNVLKDSEDKDEK